MTADADDRARVHPLVEAALGVPLEVDNVHRVTAGASKSIEIIDIRPAGGGDPGERGRGPLTTPRVPEQVVLRSEPSSPANDDGMLREAEVLTRARASGVPVPRVLAAGRAGDGYPDPYLLTTFVAGESLAPRILRSFMTNGGGEEFVRELGAHLARIHAIDVPPLIGSGGTDEFADWHDRYREMGVNSAAYEVALGWLHANRPPAGTTTLVHGDFRLGNLMVHDGRVSGVLDWELTHVGDPREDLGWLTAPPWRFRSPHPVAGLGSRQALLQGYRDAGGIDITEDELKWWEVFSTVKWGVMCLGRGHEAAARAEGSLEFALIGRRFAECEYDVLRQLGWDTIEARFADSRQLMEDAMTRMQSSATEAGDATVPSAGAVEEALVTSFGTSYQSRLQAAALQLALREARAGDVLKAKNEDALRAAGHPSERALVQKLARAKVGSAPNPAVAVSDSERAAVEQLVCARLTLANPKYLPR